MLSFSEFQNVSVSQLPADMFQNITHAKKMYAAVLFLSFLLICTRQINRLAIYYQAVYQCYRAAFSPTVKIWRTCWNYSIFKRNLIWKVLQQITSLRHFLRYFPIRSTWTTCMYGNFHWATHNNISFKHSRSKSNYGDWRDGLFTAYTPKISVSVIWIIELSERLF